MIFNIGRVRVDLSPLFFIFCALLILVDKTGMMSASIIASLIHEFSHIFSMNLVKCPPRNIKIRAYGMDIVGGICNSFSSNSIITLSGPFSNIVLSMISFMLYQKYATYFLLSFTVINASIAALNLLPIKGLDGGDFFESLIIKKMGYKKGRCIFELVSVLTAILTLGGGVFFLIIEGNPTLILLSVYLILLNIFKF